MKKRAKGNLSCGQSIYVAISEVIFLGNTKLINSIPLIFSFGFYKIKKNRNGNLKKGGIRMGQETNMQNVNVFDVASLILGNCGSMTAMKIQKLVYYCQAWSLVWDEQPLFHEKIEAWANGPVVYELFKLHRGQYKVYSVRKGNPNKLNKIQKNTILAVLKYYGNKSSQWLSDLAHMEDPWRNARKGLPENVRGSCEITHASMMEYYSGLQESS